MSKPFSKLDSLREWKKSSQSWFPWLLKFRRPTSSTKMEKSHHLILQNTKILTDYLHTLVWYIQTSNQSGLSLFSTSASWFNHFRFPAEYQVWSSWRIHSHPNIATSHFKSTQTNSVQSKHSLKNGIVRDKCLRGQCMCHIYIPISIVWLSASCGCRKLNIGECTHLHITCYGNGKICQRCVE